MGRPAFRRLAAASKTTTGAHRRSSEARLPASADEHRNFRRACGRRRAIQSIPVPNGTHKKDDKKQRANQYEPAFVRFVVGLLCADGEHGSQVDGPVSLQEAAAIS